MGGNLLSAAQEGMAMAAKTVAREQGLKYNSAYQCVCCKDDNKNCSTCARMDKD